jgi:hypothetical protein
MTDERVGRQLLKDTELFNTSRTLRPESKDVPKLAESSQAG